MRQKNNDYNIVKPIFNKMVKHMISNGADNKYKKILNQRLGELSFDHVEAFFNTLKSNNRIEEPSIIKKYILRLTYDINNIIKYIIDTMEIDRSAIEIKNDIDSYMISFGTKNVKLSLNYNEKDLFVLIKTIAHELGHVLYEQKKG